VQAHPQTTLCCAGFPFATGSLFGLEESSAESVDAESRWLL